MNFNLYTVLVGPPGTGKSPAFKAAVTEPLSSLNADDNLIENLISTTTSSGLSKILF